MKSNLYFTTLYPNPLGLAARICALMAKARDMYQLQAYPISGYDFCHTKRGRRLIKLHRSVTVTTDCKVEIRSHDLRN